MSSLKQALSMNTKRILPIIAVLGTASSLILGNLAATAYSFLSQSGQSQANTDPGIGKQVLKGVRPSLNGVNFILMGKASGGPDQISIGANMTHSAGTNATNNSTSNSNNWNITSGESGANGSPGNGANGGGGGKGGNGGPSCAYKSITGNGGIGGSGGNGGIAGSGHNGRNSGSANGGNGGTGGNGGSAFEETT